MKITQLVEELYKTYGVYVNTSKMIPSFNDGLIPVWRRLLLSAHYLAKSDYTKSASVFGYAIQHWHPHSENLESSAEILVRNNLLLGKGNWGCDIGVEPIGCAAARYTSLKSTELLENLTFKYIDFSNWIDGELDEKEPEYLPTPIPLCLIGKSEFNMIGFGIKVEIPNFKFEDIIKRLKYLIGLESKEFVPKPNLQNCKIKMSNDIFKKKGKFTIKVKGEFDIDKDNCCIYIKGWPPRMTFENIYNKIIKEMNSKNDLVLSDLSTGDIGTKIMISVNRVRNKQEYFEKLIKCTESILENDITYRIFAVKNNSVIETSLDNLILNCYNIYENTINKFREQKIMDIEKQKEDYIIIQKIRDKLHLINLEDDYNIVIENISKKIKENENRIKEIMDKYKLKSIINCSITREFEDYSNFTAKTIISNI